MKILSLHNYHIPEKPREKEYGCVCPKCGTVFIAKENEFQVGMKRVFCKNVHVYFISCPNNWCRETFYRERAQELETWEDEQNFKYKYDE